MKGPYLRVLPAFLSLHSFRVTIFTLGLRLFVYSTEKKTQKALHGRRVAPSALACILLHTDTFICFLFSSRFITS